MRNKKYYSDFKLTLESDKVDTVIGESVTVSGPVTSKRDIKIEGKVLGDVKTKGSVYLETQSEVQGNIVGKHITVCGTVGGDIIAKGRVIIASKATVNGDITMESLVVDEGGTFNGKSTMTTDRSLFRKASKGNIERPDKTDEQQDEQDQVVVDYKE